jgi:hypothetical protein
VLRRGRIVAADAARAPLAARLVDEVTAVHIIAAVIVSRGLRTPSMLTSPAVAPRRLGAAASRSGIRMAVSGQYVFTARKDVSAADYMGHANVFWAAAPAGLSGATVAPNDELEANAEGRPAGRLPPRPPPTARRHWARCATPVKPADRA